MYVDAFLDREKEEIYIVERINGERVYNTQPLNHIFYYEHPQGSHTSLFGTSCKKFITHSSEAFKKELRKFKNKGVKVYESDLNPIFRYLSENYIGMDTPKLNIGYFDIEVDFDPDRGFAPPDDPFNSVTAITIYLGWCDKLITQALVPPTITEDVVSEIDEKFENTILYTDEIELLKDFFEFIEDVDVITGWNSTGYDIPYMVNRVERVLGKDWNKNFCLWDQYPKKRKYMKFKREYTTYDLIGRVHLDYLDLYQKHNPQQLHSYRLDFVGEIEVGENKVPYSGSLDELYKNDFVKFIEYNRQDVMLLAKIDRKKKFIELANQIAHANGVDLKTTMGSVALVEQAIINEMHEMGLVVPDKNRTPSDDNESEDRTPVVGAYVARPKIGIHDHIGAVDINSLYPSVLRSLNMSPETIIGQLRPVLTEAYISEKVKELGQLRRAEAWDGIFGSLEYSAIMNKDDTEIIVDFEDGRSEKNTGEYWYNYIFNDKNNLCVTANGTIFSKAKDGMIPLLLEKWYAQRKEMQGKAKEYAEKSRNSDNEIKKKENDELSIFWNQRQQARKILLNSLYGALLNKHLRFYDERVGQSVTLTGRQITRHMCARLNEIILGKYDYVGDAIIYSDTDSSYFSAYEVLKDNPDYSEFEWSKENIIELYDGIAEIVNESFPEFMMKSFNTTLKNGAIIKSGREIVGEKGLFIKKKKYAILVYDEEGDRKDVNGKPGKLKVMGLDLKRADTPKQMQIFLEELLLDLLTGRPEQEMFDKIKEFREDFKSLNGWEKGSPKAVKALTDFVDRYEEMEKTNVMSKNKGGKILMPGHVRAALNWNKLCEINHDKYSMRCTDGSKIVVCKLKPNLTKMDSVAFPIDEPHLPNWFKELPFDHDAMEETIIDAKIENLVGVLDWDMSLTKHNPGDDFISFE